MALSAYKEAVENIVYRAANLLLHTDSESDPLGDLHLNYVNVGVIREANVESSEVTTDPDTGGRSVEIGIDFDVSCVLQQTADADIQALFESPEAIADPTLYLDRFVDIAFTDKPVASGLHLVSGISTTIGDNGLLVKGVLMNAALDYDYMGEQSGIKLNFKWRSRVADLATEFPEEA